MDKRNDDCENFHYQSNYYLEKIKIFILFIKKNNYFVIIFILIIYI